MNHSVLMEELLCVRHHGRTRFNPFPKTGEEASSRSSPCLWFTLKDLCLLTSNNAPTFQLYFLSCLEQGSLSEIQLKVSGGGQLGLRSFQRLLLQTWFLASSQLSTLNLFGSMKASYFHLCHFHELQPELECPLQPCCSRTFRFQFSCHSLILTLA